MKFIFILLLFTSSGYSQTSCESIFGRLDANSINHKINVLLKTKISKSSKNPLFTELLHDYIYNLQIRLAEQKPSYLSDSQKEMADKTVRAWIALVRKEIEAQSVSYLKLQRLASLIPYLIAQYTTLEEVQRHNSKNNLIHLDVARIEQIRNVLLSGQSINKLEPWYQRNVREHLSSGVILIPTFTNVSTYDFLTWGARVAPMMLTLEPLLKIDGIWMSSHSAFVHDIGHARSILLNTFLQLGSLLYGNEFTTFKVYSEGGGDPVVHTHSKELLKVKVNYLADFFTDIKGQLTANEIIYGGGYFFFLLHERGNYVRFIAEFMPSTIPLKRNDIISTLYKKAMDPNDLGSSFRGIESSESFHQNTNQAIEKILDLYQDYVIKNPPNFPI